MPRAQRVSIAKTIREGESIGEFMQRIKKQGPRKPLRTLRELADEFDVPYKSLQGALCRSKDAPSPVFATGGQKSSTPSNTWYDPDEVRKWWANRK